MHLPHLPFRPEPPPLHNALGEGPPPGTAFGAGGGGSLSRPPVNLSGPAEIIVAGTTSNQPWDVDLDLRTPSYTEWVARFFRRDAPANIPAPPADPDGDGLDNLAEYAFGSRPLDSNSVAKLEFALITENDEQYPAIRFRQRIGTADLTYRVQVSTDLQTWTDNSTAPTTVLVESEPVDTEGLQRVCVRSATSLKNLPQQFLRVRVN